MLRPSPSDEPSRAGLLHPFRIMTRGAEAASTSNTTMFHAAPTDGLCNLSGACGPGPRSQALKPSPRSVLIPAPAHLIREHPRLSETTPPHNQSHVSGLLGHERCVRACVLALLVAGPRSS